MLLLALGGCAEGARAPSLAVRPIEQRALFAEPAAPAPAAAAAVDQTRIDTLVAQAREGDAAFRRALDANRGAVLAGRGAAAGSETWVAGQAAASAIEAARAPSVDALRQLDEMVVVAANPGPAPEALTLAYRTVEDLVAAQAEALDPR